MFDENNQVLVDMLMKKVTDEAQIITTTDIFLVQSADELEGGDWPLNISAHDYNQRTTSPMLSIFHLPTVKSTN